MSDLPDQIDVEAAVAKMVEQLASRVPDAKFLDNFVVYASDNWMDYIEGIDAKPAAERTDEEQYVLDYARGHRFTRQPKFPD